MIDKYYNGVIEQVYSSVGKTEQNIVMVCYNNDFSISGLDKIKQYSENEDDIYFTWHEFEKGSLIEAYMPFINTVCDIYRKYVDDNFQEFLETCGVYYLQQCVLKSYYETGVCIRQESVLLDEVEYEQKRMTEAVASMLKHIAEIRPIVIVINRFHMAAKSSMELVNLLLKEPSRNIGIVLGTNLQFQRESISEVWDEILEQIEDNSQKYHIGSTGIRRAEESGEEKQIENYEQILDLSNNITALLDFDLAKSLFQNIERQVKFEDAFIQKDTKLAIYLLYAKVSMLLSDMSKSLELVEEIRHMDIPEKQHEINFECAYLTATCYMYQGKLEKARVYAQMARNEAEGHGTEYEVFRAQLLDVQVQMSGWYNIFFCVRDIPIEEKLIELLMKYNYKNHLAHIYIYAYDNRPEVVAKAYRSEAALVYFSKGVAQAKEIGNAHLVNNAFQKNIMLASTNGMNEIAMIYSVRAYQFLKDKGQLTGGRIICGIGYNLSALGYNKEAEIYYSRSIEILYRLRLPEDIAEVYYNRSLNSIILGHYETAEHELQLCMKVIEKLHLNSLRVCNLSKLYALLALVCALQGNKFNCERYLLSCRQFLNYILAKEKDKQNVEIIHDYAKCDDDMFLYTFSLALLNYMEGDNESAFSNFEAAEKFLAAAEGNQFFSYNIYRQKRMELFKAMGRTALYERERNTLEQQQEMHRQISMGVAIKILDEVDLGGDMGPCRIPEADIEVLVKQEGLALDCQNSKQQMEFISSWQKIIDVNDTDISGMVNNALHMFLNHFSPDRALYIWYEGPELKTLYNDTEVEMTQETLERLERLMREYPQGFAVSKISSNFFEHQDVIEIFDEDEVCSFVAVPFFKNGMLSSLLVTYVMMKDNWHSSIERYMLNDGDLRLYQMLFREMSYSIKRMEASREIREMNHKLQMSAVTDVLTGIYNRAGLYEQINRMAEGWKSGQRQNKVGLMFVDLDNFKSYNDTFGHDVGDIILKEMAAIFQSVAENYGFVSRYGGDEFILLLNTDDKDELESLAKEIYRRINATDGFRESIEKCVGHEIEVKEQNRITCSIGISMSSDAKGEQDIDELIKLADDLLYSVKRTEKGHYAFI